MAPHKLTPPTTPHVEPPVKGIVGQLPRDDGDDAPEIVGHMRDISNGTIVHISYEGRTVAGVKVGYLEDINKCLVKYGGRTHRRTPHGFGTAGPRVADKTPEATNGKTIMSDGALVQTGSAYTPVAPHLAKLSEKHLRMSRFDINTRFEFISDMTDSVISGDEKSLIVTGSGGLGKTFLILSRLTAAGFLADTDEAELKKRAVEQQAEADEPEEEDDEDEEDPRPATPYDYTVIKGFSTPKAMYRLLYNNKDKLVIFDDCDSILEHPIAVNLLKSALDSYEKRYISWLAEARSGVSEQDDLPLRFEFTGMIIFISNRTLGDIPQALLSRALYVDVTMTAPEKIDRIRTLSKEMEKEMEQKDKDEVVALLDEFRDVTGDLNLRTFRKICGLRRRKPERWKEMAEYILTTNV